LSFFTLIGYLSTAQQLKTMELKGIYHHGFHYYYDLKKVDGGAYGLQIPLSGLNDEEVNRRYKTFRTYRTVESIVIFVPVIYRITYIPEARHQKLNSTTFWTIYGVSVLAAIGLEITAKHHLKKGIDRYNQLILSPGSASLGATITYKF
ncbi:MAG TPA: hypothetical protein VG737_00490, partial [Cyclobacteriaceae bacterium]|nr:hypothetical protein [Cyclobacteriaceae bacterium]